MPVMGLQNVEFTYSNVKTVLKRISLSFDAGKMYVVFGPSGCGKTILLSLMGGLDMPMPRNFFRFFAARKSDSWGWRPIAEKTSPSFFKTTILSTT